MIAKFCVPQTRDQLQMIVRLAITAALGDMAAVMGQGDHLDIQFDRDGGARNVPPDLPDFEVSIAVADGMPDA